MSCWSCWHSCWFFMDLLRRVLQPWGSRWSGTFCLLVLCRKKDISITFFNRGGSRRIAKFLQESILIALDFIYEKYCPPIEILPDLPLLNVKYEKKKKISQNKRRMMNELSMLFWKNLHFKTHFFKVVVLSTLPNIMIFFV